MKEKIKAIFFDLDHTLWDYEVNSRETLSELHDRHHLGFLLGCNTDDFLRTFERVNFALWEKYNHREIDRDTIRTSRFHEIFRHYGFENPGLALQISDEYIEDCPAKSNLLPFARESLDYLKTEYELHILSNGFDDTQAVKLEASGIRSFFGEVITSETTGHRKPAREIFDYSCRRIGYSSAECLMIGDNYKADILGAMDAELNAMFFNPMRVKVDRSPHFEIGCLSEITNHL
ncbi:MAG: YjjG family noncanonical pyrimidine nucleotidase [Cyclobacteriaceae bacterium]